MLPIGRLRGRVGLITGADSTSGTGIARTLAGEGMSLMLIAQPGTQVRALAEELAREHDIRCFPASLDVSDAAAVDRIVMHTEQHVGTVDVLVNTVPGCITDALVPTMEQRGRGHIVNVPPAPPLAVDDSLTLRIANLLGSDDLAAAVLAAILGSPTP